MPTANSWAEETQVVFRVPGGWEENHEGEKKVKGEEAAPG